MIKTKINKKFIEYFYVRYIKPKSENEDIARREFIFNILLAGLFSLITLTTFTSLIRVILQRDAYVNTNPFTLLIPLLAVLILYSLGRKKFSKYVVYGFISLYIFLGTFGLFRYSYILPQGLLIFSLVIVISGILVSSRAALISTGLIIAILALLSFAQNNHIINPMDPGLDEPMQTNLAIYIFIFTTIFVVSWLSSREIERSLSRARRSERMLIKERTRELEKLQIEKAREMYKLSEFGRVSSSLLHDIANPLSAVALNIDQLDGNKKSKAIKHIQKGVSHMEEYVKSARNQLRNKEINEPFEANTKIKQVINFLKPKAKSNQVKIRLRLCERLMLNGDSSKFNQIVANLIANAIDAYQDIDTTNKFVDIVTTFGAGKTLTLTVSDKGAGIPKKELSKIFEPFFTTKASDRGTGIGLTITKRIIQEDFEGAILVKSSARGTKFIVKIPLNKK